MKAAIIAASAVAVVVLGYKLAPEPLKRDLQHIGRDLRKVFIK